MALWRRLRGLLFAHDDRAVRQTADDRAPVTTADVDVTAPLVPSMSSQTSQATIASRQERAAGRVLDDEGLRGDLADDEYQPLQDWALDQTDRIAASTAGMSDAEAEALIDAGLQTLREVIWIAGEVVAPREEAQPNDRRHALDTIANILARDNPEHLEGSALDSIRRRLMAVADRLDAEPDLSGPEVATLIVEALGTSADGRASTSQQERMP